jgi:hypothetical protein
MRLAGRKGGGEDVTPSGVDVAFGAEVDERLETISALSCALNQYPSPQHFCSLLKF